MESSKVGLQKWAIAIYMVTTNLKGVSSMRLKRDLKVTQNTAWFMLSRIRESFRDGDLKLRGEVEVDETYIGGRERNKHFDKRLQSGRGTVGKTAVIGARERGGKIKARPIQSTNAKSLSGFIGGCVETGSTVYTDDHKGYSGLSGYRHSSVRHSIRQYVDGQAHTNGIESFWAVLKRGYIGTYHKMSPKHLHRYVNEFAGRHNIRTLDTIDQMKAMARGMDGKRLRYQDLIA